MRTRTRKLGSLLTWLTLASLSLSVFGASSAWADNRMSPSAQPPQSVTLGFDCFSGNNAGDVAIGEAQLFVDVENVGGQVLFTFRNIGPAPSSIAQVYFDDTLLFPPTGIPGLIDADEGGGDAGVDFSLGASPPNLPGGNPIGFSADFSAGADSPVAHNGVNPYESLGVLFDLAAGKIFEDVLADLASGALRIGIHVQAFNSGGSESCINTPDEPPRIGTIIIIKDADPADGTDFEFTGGDLLGNFILDDAVPDDGDPYPSSIMFPGLQPGVYPVTEVIPGGDWELADIACVDPSGGTSISGPTATINLEGTETVICLFTNAKLTAIELASFTAKSSISSVLLAWETGTEVDNVGFNLYRATTPDGPYTKVNAALIAAKGDPVAGASYSFVDKGLSAGTYYYQLEDIDLNGTATLHGPVSAKALPSLRRPSYRPVVPW